MKASAAKSSNINPIVLSSSMRNQVMDIRLQISGCLKEVWLIAGMYLFRLLSFPRNRCGNVSAVKYFLARNWWACMDFRLGNGRGANAFPREVRMSNCVPARQWSNRFLPTHSNAERQGRPTGCPSNVEPMHSDPGRPIPALAMKSSCAVLRSKEKFTRNCESSVRFEP